MRLPRITVLTFVYSALLAVAGLAAIVAVFSFQSTREIGRQFHRMANQDVSLIVAAATLKRQSNAIVDSVPALILAENQRERENAVARVRDRIAWWDELSETLDDYGERPAGLDLLLAKLAPTREQLGRNIELIDETTKERLRAKERRLEFESRIRQILSEFHEQPMEQLPAGLSVAQRAQFAKALEAAEKNVGIALQLAMLCLTSTVPAVIEDTSVRFNLRMAEINRAFIGLPMTDYASTSILSKGVGNLVDGGFNICHARANEVHLENKVEALFAQNSILARRFLFFASEIVETLEKSISQKSNATQEYIESKSSLASVLVFLCVLIAVAGVVFVRARVIVAINNIRNKMLAFSPSVEDIGGGTEHDEIAQLARTFDDLVATIRKRESQLIEGEERFRDIAEASSDWFWETDADGRCTFVSDKFFSAMGVSREAVAERTLVTLFDELGFRSAPGERASLAEVLQKHQKFRGVEMVGQRTDRTVGSTRIVSVSGSPVVRNGIYLGYRGSATDVTERERVKQALRQAKDHAEDMLAELTVTQRDLVETAKMAALGKLVAGIAHEINTPIGIGVTGASYLAQSSKELHERLRSGHVSEQEFERYATKMEQGAQLLLTNMQRAAQLVASFKKVAADQRSGARQEFELSAYLRDIVNSLSAKLRRVDVTINCPDGIEIDGYPSALWQVITNLVINSITHGFEGEEGRITITVHETRNNLLRLVYWDNGQGIAPDIREHIFEPFFTTKRHSGGTGLGLNIVYNMVTNSMGGTIAVGDNNAEGATFILEFPKTAPLGAVPVMLTDRQSA